MRVGVLCVWVCGEVGCVLLFMMFPEVSRPEKHVFCWWWFVLDVCGLIFAHTHTYVYICTHTYQCILTLIRKNTPKKQQVETLFHEFGHGAQHMLTEVQHGDAAGINGMYMYV